MSVRLSVPVSNWAAAENACPMNNLSIQPEGARAKGKLMIKAAGW